MFSMPLPESASNIYFYSQSGGLQGIIGFVRFDVAQEEIHSTVEAIIERNNIQFRRELAYERRELSKIPEEEFSVPRACSKEAALDWWNPENITKGYYRGEIKSYAERLWIDEEHSRIYLFQLD
ncbi:MAG: hypothetical protein GY801_14120 [bacterium]|nr:hypothetical protein [bacterium]